MSAQSREEQTGEDFTSDWQENPSVDSPTLDAKAGASKTEAVYIVEGPMIGPVSNNSATVVFRTSKAVEARVFYGREELLWYRQSSKAQLLHSVTLSGMYPGVEYRYRVEADGISPISGRFTTMPEPGTPLSLLVFGGTRGWLPRESLLPAARRLGSGSQLLVHTGWEEDAPTLIPSREAQQGTALLRSLPCVPVAGGRQDETEFQRALRGAHSDGDAEGATWQEVEAGDMRLLVLDSSRPVDPESAQVRWLADRALQGGRVWLVVALSHAPFSGAPEGPNYEAQALLAPVFERLGVDVVIAGRARGYERSVKGSVLYIGSAGAGLRLDAASTDPMVNPHGERWESRAHLVSMRVEQTRLYLEAYDENAQVFERLLLERMAGVKTLTVEGVTRVLGDEFAAPRGISSKDLPIQPAQRR